MLHKMKTRLWTLLAGLVLMSALVSCGSYAPGKVAALISEDGRPAGVIVSYDEPLDKATVGKETYSVAGQDISKVFVSNVNPFVKDMENREGLKNDGGRYVVVFLKDTGDSRPAKSSTIEIVSNPMVEVSIRQVEDVRTLSGKTIPKWKKDFKATEGYPITGGLMK